MNKFYCFAPQKSNFVHFFVKEHNIKTKITIRPIVDSSETIRLQIFSTFCNNIAYVLALFWANQLTYILDVCNNIIYVFALFWTNQTADILYVCNNITYFFNRNLSYMNIYEYISLILDLCCTPARILTHLP